MMNRERMARSRMTGTGTTSLGLDERLERVLAYPLLWVSGLILFILERKNRNVRFNAMQSMAVFGPLTLLVFLLNVIKGILGWIIILNVFTNFALGIVITLVWWVIIILAVWLMIMAWFRPNYRLPFIGKYLRY